MIIHEISHRHSDCHLHLFFNAVAYGEAIASLVSRHFALVGGSRWLENFTSQSRETALADTLSSSNVGGSHKFKQAQEQTAPAPDTELFSKTNQSYQPTNLNEPRKYMLFFLRFNLIWIFIKKVIKFIAAKTWHLFRLRFLCHFVPIKCRCNFYHVGIFSRK